MGVRPRPAGHRGKLKTLASRACPRAKKLRGITEEEEVPGVEAGGRPLDRAERPDQRRLLECCPGQHGAAGERLRVVLQTVLGDVGDTVGAGERGGPEIAASGRKSAPTAQSMFVGSKQRLPITYRSAVASL